MSPPQVTEKKIVVASGFQNEKAEIPAGTQAANEEAPQAPSGEDSTNFGVAGNLIRSLAQPFFQISRLFASSPSDKPEPEISQQVFEGKDRVTGREVRQVTLFRDGRNVGSVTHYLDTEETVSAVMNDATNEFITVHRDKDGATTEITRLTAEGKTFKSLEPGKTDSEKWALYDSAGKLIGKSLDFSEAAAIEDPAARQKAFQKLAEEAAKELVPDSDKAERRRAQVADYLAKRAEFNPKAWAQWTDDGSLLTNRTAKAKGFRAVDVAVFKEGTRMPSGRSDGAGPGETLAVYSYLLNKKGKCLTEGEAASLPTFEYYGGGRMVQWHRVGVIGEDHAGMRIEMQEQTRSEDGSWTEGPREELASWTSYRQPGLASLIGDAVMHDVPVVSQLLQVGNSAVKGVMGSGYFIGAGVADLVGADADTRSSLIAHGWATWGDVGVSMPWDDARADTDQRHREAYGNARDLMRNDERAVFDEDVERKAFEQGWRAREFKGRAGSAHKVYGELFGDSHKSFDASVGAFSGYSFSQAPSYFLREAAVAESLPAKIGLAALGLTGAAADGFIGGAPLGLLGEAVGLIKGAGTLLKVGAHTYATAPFLIGAGAEIAQDAPVFARAFQDSSPAAQQNAYESAGRLLQSLVLLALTGHGLRKALKSAPQAEAATIAEPDLASHYEALGLEPGASFAEVKKAFRKMAAENHPDNVNRRYGGEENVPAEVKAAAAAKVRQASQAYHALEAELNSATEPSKMDRDEAEKAPEAPRALPAAEVPSAPKARAQKWATARSFIPADAALATMGVPLFAFLVENGVPTPIAALIAGATLIAPAMARFVRGQAYAPGTVPLAGPVVPLPGRPNIAKDLAGMNEYLHNLRHLDTSAIQADPRFGGLARRVQELETLVDDANVFGRELRTAGPIAKNHILQELNLRLNRAEGLAKGISADYHQMTSEARGPQTDRIPPPPETQPPPNTVDMKATPWEAQPEPQPAAETPSSALERADTQPQPEPPNTRRAAPGAMAPLAIETDPTLATRVEDQYFEMCGMQDALSRFVLHYRRQYGVGELAFAVKRAEGRLRELDDRIDLQQPATYDPTRHPEVLRELDALHAEFAKLMDQMAALKQEPPQPVRIRPATDAEADTQRPSPKTVRSPRQAGQREALAEKAAAYDGKLEPQRARELFSSKFPFNKVAIDFDKSNINVRYRKDQNDVIVEFRQLKTTDGKNILDKPFRLEIRVNAGGETEAFLRALYLKPEFQGNGVGRDLFNASMKMAREMGATRFRLKASADGAVTWPRESFGLKFENFDTVQQAYREWVASPEGTEFLASEGGKTWLENLAAQGIDVSDPVRVIDQVGPDRPFLLLAKDPADPRQFFRAAKEIDPAGNAKPVEFLYTRDIGPSESIETSPPARSRRGVNDPVSAYQ